MRGILVTAFLPLLLCNCSKPESISPAEKKVLEKEIRQMFQEYTNDVRTRGFVAELSFLDSSSDFFWVPPGFHSPLSYDSVASIIRSNAGTMARVDNTWDSLLINPLTPKLASFTGSIRSRMTDEKGKTTTVRLIESGIVVWRNEGWKLLSGQTSVIE